VLLTMTVFLLDELVCGEEACILVVLFRLDRYRRIWEDYNLMEMFSQVFIYLNLSITISIVGIPLTPSCSMEKEATQLAKFTAARAFLCWYKWDRKAAAKTSPAPVGSISRAG
jgi:threonine/homoserine efflux transporter RhtA